MRPSLPCVSRRALVTSLVGLLAAQQPRAPAFAASQEPASLAPHQPCARIDELKEASQRLRLAREQLALAPMSGASALVSELSEISLPDLATAARSSRRVSTR